MKKSELRTIIKEEINKVLKELTDGELEEAELNEVKPIITQIFAKKYPKVKLYFDQEDYIYVSTDKDDPSAASMWGEGNRRHYYLAFNLYAEGETLNLVVANATANKYSGVTGDIIKAMFDFGAKRFNPITERVLVIEDDRSDGYWEKLAQKLGADYQSN